MANAFSGAVEGFLNSFSQSFLDSYMAHQKRNWQLQDQAQARMANEQRLFAELANAAEDRAHTMEIARLENCTKRVEELSKSAPEQANEVFRECTQGNYGGANLTGVNERLDSFERAQAINTFIGENGLSQTIEGLYMNFVTDRMGQDTRFYEERGRLDDGTPVYVRHFNTYKTDDEWAHAAQQEYGDKWGAYVDMFAAANNLNAEQLKTAKEYPFFTNYLPAVESPPGDEDTPFEKNEPKRWDWIPQWAHDLVEWGGTLPRMLLDNFDNFMTTNGLSLDDNEVLKHFGQGMPVTGDFGAPGLGDVNLQEKLPTFQDEAVDTAGQQGRLNRAIAPNRFSNEANIENIEGSGMFPLEQPAIGPLQTPSVEEETRELIPTDEPAFDEYDPAAEPGLFGSLNKKLINPPVAPSGGAITSTRTPGSLSLDPGNVAQGRAAVARNVPAPQVGGVSRLLSMPGVSRGTTMGAPATTPAATPAPYAGPERFVPGERSAQPFDNRANFDQVPVTDLHQPQVQQRPARDFSDKIAELKNKNLAGATGSFEIDQTAAAPVAPVGTTAPLPVPATPPRSVPLPAGPTAVPGLRVPDITRPVVGQQSPSRPYEEAQADDTDLIAEAKRRVASGKTTARTRPGPQLSLVRGSGRTADERVEEQERIAAFQPEVAEQSATNIGARDAATGTASQLDPRDALAYNPTTVFNPRDLPAFTPPIGSGAGTRQPEPTPPAPVGGGTPDERSGVEALLHNVNTRARTQGMMGGSMPFTPSMPAPPIPDVRELARDIRSEVDAAREVPETVDVPEREGVRFVPGLGWVSGDETIQPAGEQEGVTLQTTPEVIMGSRDSTGWETTAAKLIAEKESFVSKPYFDPVGYPTVGYGQLLEHKAYDFKNMSEAERQAILGRWQPVTKEQALANLEQTLPKYAEAVDRAFNNVPLNANEKAALVSFTYNLGTGIWDRESGKHLRDLIEAGKREGNMEQARKDFVSFNKARDHTGQLKELRGLTIRRNDEWDLFTKEAPAATQLPRTLS